MMLFSLPIGLSLEHKRTSYKDGNSFIISISLPHMKKVMGREAWGERAKNRKH